MLIHENNLIWIDLEMTGLDPDHDRIIEIATVVTDSNLTVLSEGPVIAIYQSSHRLSLMDAWNIKTHTESGLIDRVKSSQYDEKKAELLTISFLEKWLPMGVSPICGSSVAHDRRFLFNHMPELEKYFHYRYLDVSTLKELVRRWRPDILLPDSRKKTHQALGDIRKSIAELDYYRQHFLKL